MLDLPATTSQDDFIPLRGGLDLVTPPLSLKPGYVRDALNFEASVLGGYTRIAGYERVDGRPNPSDAIYLTLTANVTGTIAVGNDITGATSGATGRVIYRSGTLVAYTKAVGSFQAGDLELSTGKSLMAIGGFSGGDNAPTLAQFKQYVEDGQIHYFIAADHKRGPGPGGHERGSGAQITEWVTGHFAKLDVGGTTVYDLEAPH